MHCKCHVPENVAGETLSQVKRERERERETRKKTRAYLEQAAVHVDSYFVSLFSDKLVMNSPGSKLFLHWGETERQE